MSARVLSWKEWERRSNANDDLTIFVLAPIGRDAALVEEALRRGGITARRVADVDELCERAATSAGAAIISEEALRDYAVARLARMVAQQPPWSDFPLLILTVANETNFGQTGHSRFSDSLGNFSLLERPIRLETLVRAVTTALRARQRQYEIRDHLEERKRAEVALAVSEARHRGLVTATSAILWSADPDGSFVEPQESWQSYTGQPWEKHRGLGWLEAVHPDDREDLIQGWKNARGQASSFQAEGRLWHRASGSFHYFEFRAVPMTENNGAVREWVGFVADIEDRKKAENALRRSEKLASAGRLAATIAHEINNPLEAVTNLLFLIKSDPSVGDDGKRFLELMEHELNRVVHITKQTLAFYRDIASPGPIALRELAEGLLTIYGKRMSAKDLDVKIDCPPELRLVSNPGELRQVISNLLSNALDAVGVGGRIVVRVQHARFRGKAGVRITVADNGSGIQKQDRRKIFEPFFTTKETIGTGLGLWVCRDLVEKNGGHVAYRTCVEPDRSGTTFSVFLPHSPPAVATDSRDAR
ncbi:MAG TPA: PAS domain-containing sensor histidine kinase [Terriglobales bacterium]|nr:PAS domain-containing sensor histidine kinase [Terriglobales bacterium]